MGTDATARPARPPHRPCYATTTDVALSVVAGLAAGLVNGIAGGGSLLTFPALLATAVLGFQHLLVTIVVFGTVIGLVLLYQAILG